MHNEGKFVVPKKLIRTIKKEIHKYMTSISKNEYINKLDDRGNIYSNTYHKKLKSTLLMQNQLHKLLLVKGLMIKILNLKLMILLEYGHIETFLQNVTLQIGLKKFLWLQNLKTQRRGHMLLVILTKNKLLERFLKKNCKKKE